MENSEPGKTIVPHRDETQGSEPPRKDVPPANIEQQVAPSPQAEPADSQVAPAENHSPDEGESNGMGRQLHTEPGTMQATENVLSPGEELTWTASEFIAHEKSAGWYVVLMIVGLVLSALTYLVTGHDWVSVAVIAFMFVLFGASAARKPKVQHFGLSVAGLHIGDRTYAYQTFKSFTIAEEGAVVSVVFMPMKRFMPSLTIYLAPELEEKVIKLLAERLPMSRHRQDAIDGFLRQIRF